jgi:hypothetical protein
MWHQWNKKCNTFFQILDGIITNWWKSAQMDENGQIGWNFGDKKNFWWWVFYRHLKETLAIYWLTKMVVQKIYW